jgi:hypothetical protein
MSKYIEDQAVVHKYKSKTKYAKSEEEDGIGIVRTNNDHFSCMESGILKAHLGQQEYAKLYNAVKPLHLSNKDGVPMHALANGHYFIQCIKKTETEFPDNTFTNNTVAALFRISEQEAIDLIKNINSKKELTKYVEEQKPRWKKEADNALNIITDINHKLSQGLINKNSNKNTV